MLATKKVQHSMVCYGTVRHGTVRNGAERNGSHRVEGGENLDKQGQCREGHREPDPSTVIIILTTVRFLVVQLVYPHSNDDTIPANRGTSLLHRHLPFEAKPPNISVVEDRANRLLVPVLIHV